MNYKLVFGMDEICIDEDTRRALLRDSIPGRKWAVIQDIRKKEYVVNVNQIKYIEEAEE